MNKSVAFFIKSTQDTVLSVDGVSYNESISTLVQNSQGAFWIQADEDGVQDICTQISTTINSISATFSNSNGEYALISNDFVGGRPSRRVPK